MLNVGIGVPGSGSGLEASLPVAGCGGLNVNGFKVHVFNFWFSVGKLLRPD